MRIALFVAAATAACAPASGPTPLPLRCEGMADGSVAADLTSAALRWPGLALDLPVAMSGSGARFADEDAEFWIKGSEARLTLPGAPARACRIGDRP